MTKIDDSHYDGTDKYSDGPIEDEILGMLAQNPVTTETLMQDSRWPILYHFAPERRNILEWYPFSPQGRLLEVGAGCGALTGLFCEKTAEVHAVELSMKRCKIIQQRYPHHANLTIHAGNLMDMQFSGVFDYITLIGVLEYAAAFLPDAAPYQTLLRKLSQYLAPGGVLFLAIENKLGLKYFAGAPEDHTGRAFDSIEGYPYGSRAQTFTHSELEALLTEAGFAHHKFYYPHPDYKLPREIFSDSYLPQPCNALSNAPNYDYERIRLMNETRAWHSVIAAGYYKIFANSFLIAAKTT